MDTHKPLLGPQSMQFFLLNMCQILLHRPYFENLINDLIQKFEKSTIVVKYTTLYTDEVYVLLHLMAFYIPSIF